MPRTPPPPTRDPSRAIAITAPLPDLAVTVQEGLMREWAAEHQVALLDVLHEPALRPIDQADHFLGALARIRADEIGLVLVASWRVVAPDHAYEFVVAEHHVAGVGAELLALDEPPISPADRSALHAALDLHTRLRHHPHRSSRLRARRAAGLRRGGAVPYGYRLSDDGEHLEAHPDEQEAIRLAGQLRGEHRSYAQIAEILEQHGHLNRRGRRMDPRTVANLVARARELQGEADDHSND